MRRLNQALKRENFDRPPVWFMRQAGRYHSHYQAIKREHSFMEMCKSPTLAAKVAMGPIQDFDFDAAILFSDLLFPLEALGMGLEYSPGPKLGFHLQSPADLERLVPDDPRSLARQAIGFQKEAVILTRQQLPTDKALIGFVGAPLTLFFYAVAGSHQKADSARFDDTFTALTDGRWSGFLKRVLPLLEENMALQAEGGVDSIALFDTCAGELSPELYKEFVIPSLSELCQRHARRFPDVPIVYYSRGTNPEYFRLLHSLPSDVFPVAALGIDWRNTLSDCLREFGDRFAIQGNLDPYSLLKPWDELKLEATDLWNSVLELPAPLRAAWICGLGHGVLPQVPEENVRNLVQMQREMFL